MISLACYPWRGKWVVNTCLWCSPEVSRLKQQSMAGMRLPCKILMQNGESFGLHVDLVIAYPTHFMFKVFYLVCTNFIGAWGIFVNTCFFKWKNCKNFDPSASEYLLLIAWTFCPSNFLYILQLMNAQLNPVMWWQIH